MTEVLASVCRVSDADALEPLRAEWNALALRQRNPCQRIEWAQTSLAITWREQDGPAYLYTVRRDGRLSALALMRLRRDATGEYLEDVGTSDHYEPNDWLYDSLPDLELLARQVMKTRRPIMLCRLPGDSWVPQVLQSAIGRSGLVRRIKAPAYPFIPLASCPDGALNSGRRSDLRRMRQRAERAGGLRVEFLRPQAEEMPALLDLAIAIEAASWKIQTPHALIHNPLGQRFMRDYMARAAQAGIARVAFLYIGEQPAAMQLAAASGDAYWLFKIGYDATLASMAPGQLLMQASIRACAEAGLQRFEMLGTAAEWTRVWTRDESPSWRLEAYPPCAHSARQLVGKLLAKLRHRLARKRA